MHHAAPGNKVCSRYLISLCLDIINIFLYLRGPLFIFKNLTENPNGCGLNLGTFGGQKNPCTGEHFPKGPPNCNPRQA